MITHYPKQIGWCVFSVLLATGAPVLGGVEIDPKLGDRLAGASDGEIIPIYIVMADRVDRAGLQTQYPARLYTPSERRHLLTSQAKAVAASSQGDLLNFLWSRPITEVTLVRPLWIVNVVAFEAVPSVIQEALSMPGIERAMLNEPEYILPVEPGREQAGGDMGQRGGGVVWSVNQIRAPEVWAMGITGEGVVVAHYDTGACYTHPDLAANTWVNLGEIPGNGLDDDGNGFIDDDKGWDFGSGDNDPDDDNGHGTHTMGSVVGDGTLGTQTGVAPGAKVMINKVLNFGFGDGTEVWEAYQYSLDNGAHLATASIRWITGIHDKNRADWREASDNAVYAGLILVFAAGNESWLAVPESIGTPPDVPSVIAVGATTNNDTLASFSSLGPTEWGISWLGENTDGPYGDWEWSDGGLTKPDIAAPGEDVNSTVMCNGYSGNTWSGTSMATPHIAGVIALMLQANPLLTRDDIIEIFADTAVDLGPPGMDNDFGWGRVDAFEAVLAAMTPTTIEVDLTAEATLLPAGEPIIATFLIQNTTGVSQTFDLWMDISLPDGTVINDSLLGPWTMTLPAGATRGITRRIRTDFGTSGTWVLTLKAGVFGESVIDSKALPITLEP